MDQLLDIPRPIIQPSPTEKIPPSPTPKEISVSPNGTEQKPISAIAISQSELPQAQEATPKERLQSVSYGAAEFRPEIRSLLERCGVDPTIVNPVPIGEGANHVVFMATPKEGDAFVIKIPKSTSLAALNAGHEDEKNQIDKINKAFPGYSLPTETRINEKTKQYVVIQKAVKGKPMTNHVTDPTLRNQLKEIVELNNTLYGQYGESLDFVGMPGFVSWVKRQFKKLILRKSEFEVSNLLIDEKTNHLYIVDTDVFRFKDVPLRTAFISRIGFFINRIFMKRYFGLDIKSKK